jgi:hypothetical protein
MFRMLLVLTTLVSVAAHAEAMVLCAQKSGTVKVREVCKPKEVQLDPAALGLRGPGAVVKDANGALVGVSTGYGILRNVEGIWVALLIDSNTGNFVKGSMSFWHESADCSGTGLMFATPTQLVAGSKILGTTLYYASTGTTVTISSHSKSDHRTLAQSYTF